MKPLSLFADGSDTPLFSGSPQRAQLETFDPEPEPKQATLALCPLCMDTGLVKIGLVTRRCWCKAGEKAQ